ncbi:hypothetical protein [Leeuwenhoekiella sp. MAR_2009_132]|uniref:hypothetical protein n=1 Tax=Leeuwenhoekiella sp. MAR_2009_132 TaxID=1392489 RepID=UPI00048A9B4C|nr:hypothetical protein [Leeuwenhoekiella sp. MAR_2009_132]
MKLATFNIQNLFHRDRSAIQKSYSKCVSDWVAELDSLIRKKDYSYSDTNRMRELSFLLGFDKSYQTPYAVMRKRAGFLFLKGMNYSKELQSCELTDWNGWVALQTIPITSAAINHKARVIAEVDPDILVLQEIEDKASLSEFNSQLLPEFNCKPFDELFVIQGNDKTGKETGILTKNGYKILSVKSHQYDRESNGELLFQNDFLEYEIQTPAKNKIYLLVAHLQGDAKDKDFADLKRKKQAQRVAEVYNVHRSEGKKDVVIMGTLNAPSYCHSLAPLLVDTDLKDITKHSRFNVDVDKGTDAAYFSLGAYRMGVNIKQKDYLLLSPNLFSKATSGGLSRKAVWPEKKPMWSTYSTMQNANEAASEHPVVWGEL